MALVGFHIVPKPFGVVVAALDDSMESVRQNLIGFDFERTSSEGRVIYEVKDEHWGKLAIWKVRQDVETTEVYISGVNYPQPNMSQPDWQAGMARQREEMNNAYDVISTSIVNHLNRTLARGMPIAVNSETQANIGSDDFIEKVYWVSGKSIEHIGEVVGSVQDDGSLAFTDGLHSAWERSGNLVVVDGYTIEDYLRDSKIAKARSQTKQEALRRERGEQGKSLYKSICTDPQRLREVVEAFLYKHAPTVWEPDDWKPRIHSGEVEVLGGVPVQYIIYASITGQMGSAGWAIGHVEYAPISDDEYSFELYRYPSDSPELGFDYQPQKDLLDALSIHLRKGYPNGITEVQTILDTRLPLSAAVLFDSVLEAAEDWEIGDAYSKYSAKSNAVPWTPAEWMSKQPGDALIKVTEFNILRRDEGEAIGIITIQPRLDNTTRLLIEKREFEYEQFAPLSGEAYWTIDVTTEWGFDPFLFLTELGSRILSKVGEPSQATQLIEEHGQDPSAAKNSESRPPKDETIRRQNRVKELAGKTAEEISEILANEKFRAWSVATVNRDLKELGMVKKRQARRGNTKKMTIK